MNEIFNLIKILQTKIKNEISRFKNLDKDIKDINFVVNCKSNTLTYLN